MSAEPFDVVMPLFNKAEYVAAAVESVLGQTFPHWNLFVVDDGSVDGSADIVRSFGDSRIQLQVQPNAGVSAARNAGIAAGSAAWIAFIDADDIWRNEHLEELDRVRRQHPEAWLIGCGYQPSTEPDGLTRIAVGSGAIRSVRYFAEAARGRPLFYTSSAAVRRSAVESVGGFPPITGGEDLELWARLALGGPVAVSSRSTVLYRTGIGGLSSGPGEATSPARLEDISAAIPTLLAELPGITDNRLHAEVTRYIDSRVSLALAAAVRGKRFDEARHVLGLYLDRPRGSARLYATIARLPRRLGRALVGTADALLRLRSGRRSR